MLVSKECWERGCSCYDDRVDKDPVEVVKRVEVLSYYFDQDSGRMILEVGYLQEKNHAG